MVPDLVPSCPDAGLNPSYNHLSPHKRIRMSYSSIFNYKPHQQQINPPAIQVTATINSECDFDAPHSHASLLNYCTYCQRRKRMAENQMTGSDSQKMDVYQVSDSNPIERFPWMVSDELSGVSGGHGQRNCTCYYMNRQLMMRRDSYIHHIRAPRSAPHITFMQ